MNRTCSIEAFSAITDKGLFNTDGFIPWKNTQKGPEDIERKQVYEKPHIGFGKLALPDKLAFSIVAHLLKTVTGDNLESTGIVLSTSCGSLHTDILYAKSVAEGFPRPAYFSATLPSSPLAEIAIMFKFKGPNRTIVGKNSSLIKALESAMIILEKGKTDRMLVCCIHGATETDGNALGYNIKGTPCAFAFLLSSAKNKAPYSLKLSSVNNYSTMKEKTIEQNDYELIDILTKGLNKNESIEKNIVINYFTYDLSIKRS